MNIKVRKGARALGVISVVGALALTGCSSSDSGSEDGSSAGGSELTVWHYFSADNQVKLMDDYAEKFEAAHEGVEVKNVFVPYDQLNSKLISAAGAKTGPDVVVFNGADASTLALAGALAPLDEQWGSFADADQFPDSVIHTVDDSIYAVQGYVNLLGLWYNADILAEIGVEAPTTIDDLEAAMAAAKDAGKGGITLSGLPQSQGEWQAYPWLTSQGFDYTDPQAADLESGFSMVREWVDNGWLSQESVTWDQTVPFQQFTGGNYAFAANGNWQMGAAAADASFEYGVVPLPVGDSGKVYLGGEGEGIGAHAKNPELAWEYLKATYLDAEGQLLAVSNVGSLPSRADASTDEAVTGNPLLKPFADSVTAAGANYPDSIVPAASVADLQITVGQAWSAAIGGQQDPAKAAESVMAALPSLLKK